MSKLSEEERRQLIEWVTDAFPDDPADIEEMSDIQLLKGVDRAYSGGLAQFWQDANPCDTIAPSELSPLA